MNNDSSKYYYPQSSQESEARSRKYFWPTAPLIDLNVFRVLCLVLKPLGLNSKDL